ncbi:MAG: hypothetical protein LV479_09510 [Methylacidiphilales bacterium]|nr:hypothetical protein [Candidatus Methylacidiphilales bacterium]
MSSTETAPATNTPPPAATIAPETTPSTNATSATDSTLSTNVAPSTNSTPSTEAAPATTNAPASTTAIPSGGGSLTFANASFETPTIGDYSYTPENSGWAFTNNAGITTTGAGAYGAPKPPDGTQCGLLQGVSGTLGTMSQSVSFPDGTYTISFYGAQRFDQVQPIAVSVDGAVVGTYTPASNTFAQITTAAFKVAAGNHTITFAATDKAGDKTSFIDLISINVGGGNAPAAPTGSDGSSTNSIPSPADASASTNAASGSTAVPSTN